MTEKLMVVSGVGMVSPVGLTALQTCAAIRSGIAAFRQLEGYLDSTGHPVIAARLPRHEAHDGRALSLTDGAIKAAYEALTQVDLEAVHELMVAILTSEPSRPGKPLDVPRLTSAIRAEFGRQVNNDIRVAQYEHGHAGAALALQDLAKRLNSERSMGLIIGADSLLSRETIAYLDRYRRLKSPLRPRGVIPGEAAAALVVESAAAFDDGRRRAYCHLVGIGLGTESVTVVDDGPCLAEGLTNAVRSALENAGWDRGHVAHVYSDLNGEPYGGHEWMLVRCRTLSEPQITHPADCIGDVGAAALPLLIGMGAVAFARNLNESERALACASSDFGLRGVVGMSAA